MFVAFRAVVINNASTVKNRILKTFFWKPEFNCIFCMRARDDHRAGVDFRPEQDPEPEFEQDSEPSSSRIRSRSSNRIRSQVQAGSGAGVRTGSGAKFEQDSDPESTLRSAQEPIKGFRDLLIFLYGCLLVSNRMELIETCFLTSVVI